VRVLNVGGNTKAIALPARYEGWDHVLLDIAAGPDVDIVCDARAMAFTLSPCIYDACYCAHNLEHYHAHEIPLVLAGMAFALKPGGEVHIVVPNVGQLICEMVEHKIDLDDVLYMCPAGEITPLDVLFGWGREIEGSGEPFFAHKTGFTARRLHRCLETAGFKDVKVVANLDRLELEGTGHV
jgi:SAM-dependent methyltransferase